MVAALQRTGSWKLQIVRRCRQHRFVVLPKRWIVERTIGWISRSRRLARDYERHIGCVAALVRLAMIRVMLRRLTRYSGQIQTFRIGSESSSSFHSKLVPSLYLTKLSRAAWVKTGRRLPAELARRSWSQARIDDADAMTLGRCKKQLADQPRMTRARSSA
jgi:hypothetical protein